MMVLFEVVDVDDEGESGVGCEVSVRVFLIYVYFGYLLLFFCVGCERLFGGLIDEDMFFFFRFIFYFIVFV